MMVVLVAALHGCAPAPYFKLIDPLPDGMAMVYVYRPTHDIDHWQSQSVYVNDRRIASLSTLTYTAYTTSPGIMNVKIRGLREAYMRFEVKAGKSYFLKSSINKIGSQSTATSIDVLTFMEPEPGLQDIRNCQLSSDTSALSSY
jgi:hypothetical protein